VNKEQREKKEGRLVTLCLAATGEKEGHRLEGLFCRTIRLKNVRGKYRNCIAEESTCVLAPRKRGGD